MLIDVQDEWCVYLLHYDCYSHYNARITTVHNTLISGPTLEPKVEATLKHAVDQHKLDS